MFAHFDLMPEYQRLIAPQLLAGSFAYVEDIRNGLAEAPVSLTRVLTGASFGKSLIRMDGD